MNRLIILLLLITITLVITITHGMLQVLQADEALKVQIDDYIIDFKEYIPIMLDGAVYVPADFILSLLGVWYRAEGDWYIVASGKDVIRLKLNQRFFKKNEDSYITKKAAVKFDSIVYIPIRTIANMFSWDISYSSEERTVSISTATTSNSSSVATGPATPEHLVDTSDTYLLNEIEEDIFELVERYSEIASLDIIGESVEGRPIYAIRVGLKSEVKKPALLFMGGIHAREDFSVMFCMKSLDHLLYAYYDDGSWEGYDVRALLNNVDVHFVPILNPDGLNIAHNGIATSNNYELLKDIKNVAGDDRWWKSNANGVDLNRNFDDGNWKLRTIKNPASEGYRGPSPNSEPETQAIQNYCIKNLFTMAVSLHCSGEVLYWADTDTHDIFEGYDSKVIKRISKITGYKSKPVSKKPAVFGAGFENWFKTTFQRFGFCMELAPELDEQYVQHDDDKFDELVWGVAQKTLPELMLQTVELNKSIYDVYQNGVFLKSFYSEGKAKSYTKKLNNSIIIHRGNTIIDK